MHWGLFGSSEISMIFSLSLNNASAVQFACVVPSQTCSAAGLQPRGLAVPVAFRPRVHTVVDPRACDKQAIVVAFVIAIDNKNVPVHLKHARLRRQTQPVSELTEQALALLPVDVHSRKKNKKKSSLLKSMSSSTIAKIRREKMSKRYFPIAHRIVSRALTSSCAGHHPIITISFAIAKPVYRSRARGR